MIMPTTKNKELIIGKKTFAHYSDEFSDAQINFIPVYFLNEEGETLIGTKNNMVGTEKGYFDVIELTGKTQLNKKYLSNIYTKKKD